MNNEIESLKEKLKIYNDVLLLSLELVPDEKLEWKPFDCFRSLGEQFYHVGQIEEFYIRGIRERHWDLPNALKSPGERLTKDFIKNYINSAREKTLEFLGEMIVEDLNRVVKIPSNPTNYSIRHWLYYILEHKIHHKAQISVFLRQLGITPPFFAFAFPNNFRPDMEIFTAG
jgi:uncharacterized damage-inducible protein DinB